MTNEPFSFLCAWLFCSTINTIFSLPELFTPENFMLCNEHRSLFTKDGCLVDFPMQ